MGILADDIARVRAATDFVAVASEHIALKRVGRRWVGLCPFHTEKSGSFSVNAEEGLYYCFGCGAGGDAIRFVQEVEHLDFADAVERLAARAGIQVHYDTVAVSQERQRRATLLEAMEKAVEWYHQRLLTGRDAAPARSYLRSRGYDGDVVRAYRLGWAPDDWDALSKALHLPTDVLHDCGLGRINKIGRQQDEFRARLLFPIFDVRGDAIAFGGRALPGAQGPKYKNSPESPPLRQEPHPLRAQLGQGRHRDLGRGGGVRGLHRRHRAGVGGPAPGRGHVRHRPHRGPLPHPQELRPPGGAGLRRRRRRPGRGGQVLRVGAAVRGRHRGGRPACRAPTLAAWPRAIPTPSAPPSTTPAPSSPSASSGPPRGPTCAPPRAGPRRPRRPWPWSGSTPATSSATST